MDMPLFFQRLAENHLAGDLNAVLACYAHPLVVYEPTGILIHKTPEDSARRLAERLISLRSGGAVAVKTRLEKTGPVLNKRQPYDVTKTYLDDRHSPVGESRLRYFCRSDTDQIRVELIEILQSFRMDIYPTASVASH
ncbi:hypothetical protein [Kangsaoukella pontilimi]|nr:hypothetical protein [Kangsaoukella pontilimi]